MRLEVGEAGDTMPSTGLDFRVSPPRPPVVMFPFTLPLGLFLTKSSDRMEFDFRRTSSVMPLDESTPAPPPNILEGTRTRNCVQCFVA